MPVLGFDQTGIPGGVHESAESDGSAVGRGQCALLTVVAASWILLLSLPSCSVAQPGDGFRCATKARLARAVGSHQLAKAKLSCADRWSLDSTSRLSAPQLSPQHLRGRF